MAEERSSVSIKLSKRVKFLIIGLLVGALLGIAGTLFVQNHNPKDESSIENASVVFDRIVQQNELVSVSQDYMMVEKSSDTARLFDIVDIPITTNSFWYRYVGTIKAGVGLGDAELSTEGSTITVSLSDPYIISNTPNMDQTGVLEEANNILNPIHVEDVDALQEDCRSRSEEQAVAGGLLEEAKAEAENNIRNLFYAALGDSYTVEFQWRSSGEQAPSEANGQQ